MALEVSRCEILISYWLAKLNVKLEKSAKMLRCPLSVIGRDLPQSLNNISVFPAIFSIRFGMG
jgi:hypothetical protein